MEQKLTRTQRRELKEQSTVGHHHHLKTRQAIQTAATVVIILMLAGYAGYAFNTWRKGLPEKPYTDGPVHWHAKINVTICGEARELPVENKLTAHGRGAVGTPLLHHHNDGTAHIEGRVLRPEEISLGAFFDAIGGKFSETEIFDKKNGDACDNEKQGQAKVYANGMEVADGPNYILKDGDAIDIKFE